MAGKYKTSLIFLIVLLITNTGLHQSTCQWFPFHAIMEHTGNIMQYYMHLISSLLKMFSVFEIRLSYGEKYLDTLCLKCIHCKKETGLNSETNFTWVYDEFITKFV